MSGDPGERLIDAVCTGDLKKAKALIEAIGLSYSKDWSNGYYLLCKSLKHSHRNIARLLLLNGSEVKSAKPLHLATKNGYTDIVSLLLERNANFINVQLNSGITALHRAVKLGHLAIVKKLLNYGARVNTRFTEPRKNHYTPLHDAASQGNAAVVNLLLSNGADVHARTGDNETPLHIATRMQRKNVVKLLLDVGADVDSLGKNEKSVLHSAVDEHSDSSTINLILKYGPKINKDNRRSFYAAILGDDYDCRHNVVKALLQYGFTIHPKDAKRTELFYAAVVGKGKAFIEIVESLLRFGVDVNVNTGKKKSAIEYAIQSGNREITKLLLNAGARVTVTSSILQSAVKMECCEILEILLQSAPNIDLNATDTNGGTLLHRTISNSASTNCSAKIETAKMLIKLGICVNAKTEDGTSALHFAAKNDNARVIKLLLANGANIEAKDNLGNTALHVASRFDAEKSVQFLVKQKTDINAKNRAKSTPLHIAADEGSAYIVDELLKFGATIEAKDMQGRTALHLAARSKCSHTIRILLEYGSDVNVTCNASMTPLEYLELQTDESGSDDDSDDWNSTYPAEVLIKKHIIAIMAIDRYVSGKNLMAIESFDNRPNILQRCQTEISKMRTKIIGNSNVTYYDVLTGNTNRLVSYARNEGIVNALETKYLDGVFPTYSKMITQRMRHAKKRKDLLNASLKSLNILSGYTLPDLSAIELSHYLSNDDLENLAKANSSHNDCKR